jgi:ankyrin repeat protein
LTTIDETLAAETPAFARAVKAVITGNVAALQTELSTDPTLARARSVSAHRATLLLYVAANGIEGELQRQVPNSDEVAAALLHAGAVVDAECDAYGGQCTTLDLLVSSDHPYEAGVTGKVVTLLCASGAAVQGREGDGSPLATALYFGILDGVQALIACGARTDSPIFAAAAGDADWIRAWLDGNVGAVSRPGPSYFPQSADRVVAAEQALVFAGMCGQVEIIELLAERGVNVNASPPGSHWTATPLHAAAIQGHVGSVAMLLAKGADPSIKDVRHNATPAGWIPHARGPRKTLRRKWRAFCAPAKGYRPVLAHSSRRRHPAATAAIWG